MLICSKSPLFTRGVVVPQLVFPVLQFLLDLVGQNRLNTYGVTVRGLL